MSVCFCCLAILALFPVHLDPELPGKIRWDRHLEYPFLTKGNLRTRPLGIAIANGALHFSEGDSIFRRNDEPNVPTYTEILDLNDDTDTDVGGIRGLTAVKNPNGPGHSLLMLWAPGGRSTSQVKRLDPDGKGYTVRDEASMLDLMSKALGVKVTYTLGGAQHDVPRRSPRNRRDAPHHRISREHPRQGPPSLERKRVVRGRYVCRAHVGRNVLRS